MISELNSDRESFFINGTEEVMDPFTSKDMLELYKTAIKQFIPFFLIGIVETERKKRLFTDGICLRGYTIHKIDESINQQKQELTKQLARLCLLNDKSGSLDADLKKLNFLEDFAEKETLTTKKINELLSLLTVMMPNEYEKIEKVQFVYFSTFDLMEKSTNNLKIELKPFSELYRGLKIDCNWQEHRFFDAVNYHLTGNNKEIGSQALFSFAMDLEEVNKNSEAKDCYIALAQRFDCLTSALIKKSDIDFELLKGNVISEYLNRFPI